jgi:hypothetical protein
MNDEQRRHRSWFIVQRSSFIVYDRPHVSVEDLRQQLRDRGYLTHGIERWFALDPWSSRAFWLELMTVCAKGAVLVAAFGMLPFVAVMLFRNRPLTALETLELAIVYGAALMLLALALLVVIALLLKARPALVIDTPRALLAIAFAASAILAAPLAAWWYRFPSPPSNPEIVTGLALAVVWFVMATIAVSATLLSFSIYEVQRVPAIHQRSRAVPITLAAVALAALLFLPAYAAQEKGAIEPPQQVVTTPTSRRVVLIAVDGLTYEVFRARPDLASSLGTVIQLSPLAGGSTAERWSTIGTGLPARAHGVHAVEGVRLPGGRHLLQNISGADIVLRAFAQGEPLPPTVRRRDFVWEIFAKRSIVSLSVNWWTTGDTHSGALTEIGQASIFKTAAGDAVAVDRGAMARLLDSMDRDRPQFATVYLPALDVLLNRQSLDQTTRLAGSVRALDGVRAAIDAVRQRGYDVLIVGLPGDNQAGSPVLGSSLRFPERVRSPYDVAPTLCSLLGFPASNEMTGSSLAGESQPRIATYGARTTRGDNVKVDEEYYNNLKSLGYIR